MHHLFSLIDLINPDGTAPASPSVRMSYAHPHDHAHGTDHDRHEHEDERDEEEIHQKSAARPDIVYQAIMKEGEGELDRATAALFWSGLAAGLAMGLSFMTQALLRSHLPDAQWRPLVDNFGYTIGFLAVVLGRQQLFTENTLTAVLPLLKNKTAHLLGSTARLWTVVLLANVAGAALFAFVAAKTPAFDESTRQAMLDLGKHATSHGVLSTFVRAIFAGWLIALMVWLLPAAETARVGVIVIVTYVVGLAGFSHIIAGSVDTLYLVFTRHASPDHVLLHWFLPTLAGNILGGTTLVAALNHAQVTSGEHHDH